MKVRSLISNQSYFGMDPLAFQRAAGRVLERVNKLPPEKPWLSMDALGKDFRLEPEAAQALAENFVAKGLLLSQGCPRGEYRLTDLFKEYAQARVVPPLTRARAKELLDEACKLASQINMEWTHNPLVIHMIAVSGSYMSRHNRISDLTLWLLVKRRSETTSRRLRPTVTKADGAAEIRGALRALSGFIVAHTVADKATIERPFAVPFRDTGDAGTSAMSTGPFRQWASSLRRPWMRRGSATQLPLGESTAAQLTP
jgi:hypothetical protein